MLVTLLLGKRTYGWIRGHPVVRTHHPAHIADDVDLLALSGCYGQRDRGATTSEPAKPCPCRRRMWTATAPRSVTRRRSEPLPLAGRYTLRTHSRPMQRAESWT